MKRNPNLSETILACAEECFTEKGYAETTVRDIAQKANISPGTIYLYFKGKKELFDALNIPQAAAMRPQHERKKKHLLNTALLLFGEKGYDGVTMDDIATQLGVAKSTLYQYCTSKEDLFTQILQNSSFNMFTQKIATKQNKLDIRSIIKSIGRSYLQIGETPERSALFKSVIRDSSQFPELGKIYYEQGIKPACNNIQNYIEQHCKEHHKPTHNSKTLYSFILTYIGTLQSFVLMHDIMGGVQTNIEREEYLEITTNIFLDYLKANEYI